jgi:aspartyl-tRNA(Asn)/glutamyl-tRNA(Gln) amidotransferase subunit A
MALSWTMDKIGPMARSADDCALVLAAIAGKDAADPTSVSRGFALPPAAGRRFRIGVLKDAADGTQTEVAANFRASLETLRETAEIVPEVELPDFPSGVITAVIIAAEGSSAFDELIESGRVAELTAPEDRIGGYAATAISARDYLRAVRVRRLLGRAFDDVLRQYDVVAVPTRTTVASPLDKPFRDGWPGITGGVNVIGPSNVVGVPAISLPNGFGQAGLPTGLSFVARSFEEGRLVQLASWYQRRTDWHVRRPANR